jgi:hypothetical protein
MAQNTTQEQRRKIWKPGMMVHACGFSTRRQRCKDCRFKASLRYTASKNQKEKMWKQVERQGE